MIGPPLAPGEEVPDVTLSGSGVGSASTVTPDDSPDAARHQVKVTAQTAARTATPAASQVM